MRWVRRQTEDCLGTSTTAGKRVPVSLILFPKPAAITLSKTRFCKNEAHVHEMYTPKPSPGIHHIYFSIFYMISRLKLVYNFLCSCMTQVRFQILTLLITDFVRVFFRAPRAVHETLPRNRGLTKHETLASANGRQRVISVVRYDVRELRSAWGTFTWRLFIFSESSLPRHKPVTAPAVLSQGV